MLQPVDINRDSTNTLAENPRVGGSKPNVLLFSSVLVYSRLRRVSNYRSPGHQLPLLTCTYPDALTALMLKSICC